MMSFFYISPAFGGPSFSSAFSPNCLFSSGGIKGYFDAASFKSFGAPALGSAETPLFLFLSSAAYCSSSYLSSFLWSLLRIELSNLNLGPSVIPAAIRSSRDAPSALIP